MSHVETHTYEHGHTHTPYPRDMSDKDTNGDLREGERKCERKGKGLRLPPHIRIEREQMPLTVKK